MFFPGTPTDPRQGELQAKLREAGRGVDPGWLAAVSRTVIESCGVTFQFRCPKRWEQLQPTAEEDIRFHDGVDTAVTDGQTLSIVPAVAGG